MAWHANRRVDENSTYFRVPFILYGNRGTLPILVSPVDEGSDTFLIKTLDRKRVQLRKPSNFPPLDACCGIILGDPERFSMSLFPAPQAVRRHTACLPLIVYEHVGSRRSFHRNQGILSRINRPYST